MSDDINGIIIIRENTPLPAGLTLASEPFVPGWKILKNLDGNGLARKIEESNWNLFYLTGDIRTVTLGFKGPRALRRLVQRALLKRSGQKHNALEISRVVSRRFFGIPFVLATTYSRHIQEGRGLVPTENFVLRAPGNAADPVREAVATP